MRSLLRFIHLHSSKITKRHDSNASKSISIIYFLSFQLWIGSDRYIHFVVRWKRKINFVLSFAIKPTRQTNIEYKIKNKYKWIPRYMYVLISSCFQEKRSYEVGSNYGIDLDLALWEASLTLMLTRRIWNGSHVNSAPVPIRTGTILSSYTRTGAALSV